MISHEKCCTLNPNRYCKLCKTAGELNDIPDLLNKYKEYKIIHYMTHQEEDNLLMKLKQDTGSCPNCILTIIRLCHLQLSNFDYKEELKKFWESMRD
jgi:hypothetical protein